MKRATGVPLRPLVVLAVLVLASHALVLRGVPAALTWRRAPTGVTPLVMRTVTSPAPLAPAAVLPHLEPTPPRPAAPRPLQPRRAVATPLPARAAAPPAPASQPAIALPPAQVPAPALWHYAASALRHGTVLPGQAQLHWWHDGSRYAASLRVAVPPLPIREQHSEGAVTPEGLAPLRFSDRIRSEEATHFEPEPGRIVFSSNRPPAALQPGAQDRLSVLLQLAATVAADPARFVAGASVSMQTAGTREVDDWQFSVDGTEALDLPGGPIGKSLKFTRLPRREYDLKLEVWLGPGPAYAPVRLRLTPPNGDWLDLQWSGTDKG